MVQNIHWVIVGLGSWMLLAGNAMAFTPSAQQIAQFQKLPQAQQQALAQQYGVNLDQLQGNSDSSNAQQALQQVDHSQGEGPHL